MKFISSLARSFGLVFFFLISAARDLTALILALGSEFRAPGWGDAAEGCAGGTPCSLRPTVMP